MFLMSILDHRRWLAGLVAAGTLVGVAAPAQAAQAAEPSLDELVAKAFDNQSKALVDGMPVYNTGYVDAPSTYGLLKAEEAAPKTWLAPGTAVKDQGNSGSCWGFGALGALESSKLVGLDGVKGTTDIAKGIKANQANKSYDYSEAQLPYVSYHRGGTRNDSFDPRDTASEGYNDGGNWIIASSALAYGLGVINDKDNPFDINDIKGMASRAQAKYSDDTATVRSVRNIDGITNVKTNADGTVTRAVDPKLQTEVKELLRTNGGAWLAFNAPNTPTSYTSGGTVTMKDGKATAPTGFWSKPATGAVTPAKLALNVFHPDADTKQTGADHAVTLLGYDDTYSRFNFAQPASEVKSFDTDVAEKTSMTVDGKTVDVVVPKSDGAWVVRNSWGGTVGDSGYEYVSYMDKTIMEVTFYDAENVKDGSKGYSDTISYDGVGGVTGSLGADTNVRGANVFTAGKDYTVRGAGVWADGDQSTITVKLYTGVTDGNPESGTLAATGKATFAHQGYYRMAFDKPVKVAKGAKYSITVESSTPDYGEGQIVYAPHYVPVELKVPDAAYTVTAAKGQSYLDQGDGKWLDVTTIDPGAGRQLGNVAVKAIADDGSGAYQDNTGLTPSESVTPTPDPTPTVVDKSKLQRAIADAKGRNLDAYTDESANTVRDALANAEKVNADANADQTTVDKATQTLSDALAALRLKPTVDRTALNTAVADAEARDLSKYTDETAKAVSDALAVAKAVPADADQATVDKAAKTLSDAVKALKAKPADLPEPGTKADTTRLDQAISNAKALDLSKYTDETADAVRKALADAEKERADTNSDQSRIDEAARNLEDTLDELVPKTVDRSKLDEAIRDAEARNLDAYTDETANAVKDALAAAKAVPADADQATVDKATKTLTDAVNALEPKTNNGGTDQPGGNGKPAESKPVDVNVNGGLTNTAQNLGLKAGDWTAAWREATAAAKAKAGVTITIGSKANAKGDIDAADLLYTGHATQNGAVTFIDKAGNPVDHITLADDSVLTLEGTGTVTFTPWKTGQTPANPDNNNGQLVNPNDDKGDKPANGRLAQTGLVAAGAIAASLFAAAGAGLTIATKRRRDE